MVREWFLERAVRPALIQSSPFRRARETALPLGASTGCPLTIDEALRETELGVWEGRLSADLRHDPAYRRWRNDPEQPPPGGERLSEVAARVWEAVLAVAGGSEPGDVAMFTHQHSLLGVLARLGRAHDAQGRLLRLPNASIVVLRVCGADIALQEVDRTIHLRSRPRVRAVPS